ncbi:unnamed protein product [Symbiodinium pilosum]|uniref:Uncharacterized protein n=1 Tax=Symbiodinium pilosum TaxID=2952 RepID=A0A812XN77_SYMPI|nr:unnamed protein product [Symbiodinium pilosum]
MQWFEAKPWTTQQSNPTRARHTNTLHWRTEHKPALLLLELRGRDVLCRRGQSNFSQKSQAKAKCADSGEIGLLPPTLFPIGWSLAHPSVHRASATGAAQFAPTLTSICSKERNCFHRSQIIFSGVNPILTFEDYWEEFRMILYEEMMAVAKCVDTSLVLRSFRGKIFRRRAAVPVNDNVSNLRSNWQPTLEDVKEGYMVGSFRSTTYNLINKTAKLTQKLQLPSADVNVATPSEPFTRSVRQVPIEVDHRRFSTICLKDPDVTRQNFIMIGHPFGPEIFSMVAFNFYHDKYGFETSVTAPSARKVAEEVHFLLGAQFEEKKLQLTPLPAILGTAGKLKGKLMFGACQLWGKVGRAFFRPILERQYMKDMDADRMCLNAPPGEVSLRCEKKCDVVIFTDGSTCGPRKKERGRDRVGAVMFHRREYCPFQFSQVIRKDEEDPVESLQIRALRIGRHVITCLSAKPSDGGLQALAMGSRDDLFRACVDCGLKTGCYCDGLVFEAVRFAIANIEEGKRNSSADCLLDVNALEIVARQRWATQAWVRESEEPLSIACRLPRQLRECLTSMERLRSLAKVIQKGGPCFEAPPTSHIAYQPCKKVKALSKASSDKETDEPETEGPETEETEETEAEDADAGEGILSERNLESEMLVQMNELLHTEAEPGDRSETDSVSDEQNDLPEEEIDEEADLEGIGSVAEADSGFGPMSLHSQFVRCKVCGEQEKVEKVEFPALRIRLSCRSVATWNAQVLQLFHSEEDREQGHYAESADWSHEWTNEWTNEWSNQWPRARQPAGKRYGSIAMDFQVAEALPI